MLEVGASTIRLVPVAKAGGVRWLVRLEEPDASAYASRVARVVPSVESTLSPAVVANRVADLCAHPPAIRLEAWQRAHDRYRCALRALSSAAGAAMITDVRACYASISPVVVGRSLLQIGCPDADAQPIVSALRAFGRRGIRGLPVGPEASAVLANAVLAGVDRALESAGLPHVRWVDDVIAFAPDQRGAVRGLEVVRAALADLGLAPSREKTRIVLDPGIGDCAVPASSSGTGAAAGARDGVISA